MGRKNHNSRSSQADQAADELFSALLAGAKIEVPQSLSLEDPVIRAVIRLREKYPQITTTMLQSKSLVLSLGNAEKAAKTNQGWAVLDAHGYFPPSELPAQTLLGAHEGFMRRNEIDPREAEKAAREEAGKNTRIEVAEK